MASKKVNIYLIIGGIVIALIIGFYLIFSAIGKGTNTDEGDKKITDNSQDTKKSESENTNNNEKESIPMTELEEAKEVKVDFVEEKLKNMTLQEKLGQMFMVDFRKDAKGQNILKINQNIKDVLSEYHIGGVCMFAENIDNEEQIVKLIKDMQAVAHLPLFMSVDEEGGIVSRLTVSPRMNAKVLPNSKVVGDSGDLNYANEIGQILGKELKELGFNMDFAPVADVNTNPKNPVIGVRSYGNDPELVAKMVSSCLKGIQSEQVSSVIKHYPGHGDTSTDTHKGLVTSNNTLERLRKIELVPFKRGIDSDVDGIMVSHITFPKIEKDSLPATFSKTLITDILRNELEFNNLIITDALDMGAISDNYTPGQAVINAISAGVDIVLMPEKIEECFPKLEKAVTDGRIPMKQIDDSVKRILRIKLKRGIIKE